MELVGSWTAAAGAGRAPPPSVAGTGEQPRATAAVPPSGWYESASAHGGALGLMVAGFAGFGLVAVIRRLRAARPGPGPEPAPAAAGVLAVAGLASVAGTRSYLVTLTVTRGGSAIDPGQLLAGRPLPWLGLQSLAAITVAAAVALVARLARRPAGRRSGDERVRLTLLVLGAAAYLPWAFYWGLLIP